MNNTGGPAFPLPNHTKRWNDLEKRYEQDEGMTLRDYFAAKAMQGMLSHHGAVQNKKQAENDAAGAARAYAVADAMLKAREQK
jgi:hypothetical protein